MVLSGHDDFESSLVTTSVVSWWSTRDDYDYRRLACTQSNLYDHRKARNIGERLAGQPGRGETGRDKNQVLSKLPRPYLI